LCSGKEALLESFWSLVMLWLSDFKGDSSLVSKFVPLLTPNGFVLLYRAIRNSGSFLAVLDASSSWLLVHWWQTKKSLDSFGAALRRAGINKVIAYDDGVEQLESHRLIYSIQSVNLESLGNPGNCRDSLVNFMVPQCSCPCQNS
jgi:hypothetical protein